MGKNAFKGRGFDEVNTICRNCQLPSVTRDWRDVRLHSLAHAYKLQKVSPMSPDGLGE